MESGCHHGILILSYLLSCVNLSMTMQIQTTNIMFALLLIKQNFFANQLKGKTLKHDSVWSSTNQC